jgi:tetratricopeptide (TPR) repeat protein
MTLRHSANLITATAVLLAAHAVSAQVDTKSAPPPPAPDRGAAYYHEGLAHLYEEMAVNNGRPDYATQAVEEYKLALNADPTSKYLQDHLADLYFKIGRIREAVTTAQDQIKKYPDDIDAHTLLGKVYLRSLNDMQGPQATEMLQLAIAEYEKLAQLKPKDVDTHLLLGQLYGINHDTAKAEAQFKLAQGLDSNSEEATLNMARLYTEQGQPQQAVNALTSIPAADRSGRVNFALGASYDQLKKYHQAAEAYRASLEEESDNPDTQHALATALVNDGQLTEALSVYQDLVKADPARNTTRTRSLHSIRQSRSPATPTPKTSNTTRPSFTTRSETTTRPSPRCRRFLQQPSTSTASTATPKKAIAPSFLTTSASSSVSRIRPPKRSQPISR